MAASAASAGPGNSANAARMEMEHGHKGSNGLRQTINPATRTAGKESQSWVVGERKFHVFWAIITINTPNAHVFDRKGTKRNRVCTGKHNKRTCVWGKKQQTHKCLGKTITNVYMFADLII